MLRLRRRDARTVAKLAKAFAALDAQAHATRPAPRRTLKITLGS
jgi:hypothetical protein